MDESVWLRTHRANAANAKVSNNLMVDECGAVLFRIRAATETWHEGVKTEDENIPYVSNDQLKSPSLSP